MGKGRNEHKTVIRKPHAKRPLSKQQHILDSLNWILGEMVVNWIELGFCGDSGEP
jgi:hypothetical protein